jgi:hypothetical protein
LPIGFATGFTVFFAFTGALETGFGEALGLEATVFAFTTGLEALDFNAIAFLAGALGEGFAFAPVGFLGAEDGFLALEAAAGLATVFDLEAVVVFATVLPFTGAFGAGFLGEALLEDFPFEGAVFVDLLLF